MVARSRPSSDGAGRRVYDSDGRRFLSRAVDEHRLAPLARETGIPIQTLCDLVLGRVRRPSLETAVLLEDRAGVPVRSWLTLGSVPVAGDDESDPPDEP